MLMSFPCSTKAAARGAVPCTYKSFSNLFWREQFGSTVLHIGDGMTVNVARHT